MMKTSCALFCLSLFVAFPAPAANHMAAGGSGHSMLLDGDGRVWGWGYNKYGTLGDGSTNTAAPYAQTAARHAAIEDVVSISAGQGFDVALKSDGTVWTWGYGYLGHGAYEGKTTPTQVAGLGNVQQAASGLYHTLALTHGGKLHAWGNNSRGGVGDGSNLHRATPVALDGLSDVSMIAASGHSLALKRDATVWAWGENNYGQTGGTVGQNANTPQQVAGVSGIKQIAAGRYHSLALQSDGTVLAWGQGTALGDGSGKDSAVPVKVSGLADVRAIAAGEGFSLALKNDGTLWVFGVYEFALTGNHLVSLTPRQVAGLSDIEAIGAGFYHAIAIKRDGTVWAWGLNDVGQLGNGGSGNALNTPAQVGADGGNMLTLAPQSTPNIDVDRLFNWAEFAYPALFSSHSPSLAGGGYYYRCYAANRCLGEKNGDVFYYDGTLLNVGKLSDLVKSSVVPAGF